MPIKSLATKLKNTLHNYKNDEKGAVAVIFGLSLIPVMLSAGIAVDYSRISHTRGIVAEALDAAVLMSGQALAEGRTVNRKFRQEFEAFFLANVNGRTNLADMVRIASFDANPATGKVSARVNTDVKMAFMGIVGKNAVTITIDSEARFSSKKVELAMMLDVTGSMRSQGKLAALKKAATNAIDILIPASATNSKVRIGLVPYSSSVNMGRSLSRIASNNPRNKCATERYSNRFNDVSFATSKVEGRERRCPGQKVQPLTTNAKRLKSTINSLSASGATAGHLGVAWSYYTLSPNWTRAWPSSPTPASYSDAKVQKIAILMTDGEFNKIYSSGWNSSQYAISTCADMKRKGILVYSIAFKAPASARATLRSCATPDAGGETYYYSADSSAALSAAFSAIANDIQRLRLSK